MTMTPAATGSSAYALLADGTMIEIRPAQPGDFTAVKAMHEALSPDSVYLRFFSLSKLAAEREAQRICLPGTGPEPGHAALLALCGGEVVGAATYKITDPGDVAEVAFAVADRMHGRGVATLLLEHLVSLARSRRLRAFTAETLTENTAMLKVFTNAGLPIERQMAGGVIEWTFPLPESGTGEAGQELDSYLDAVARREGHADVESLRHLLQPASVAVAGASRRERNVGRAILHNIVTGGYAGRVYAVNPHATRLEGVPCLPSVAALPEPVDLAIVAVPPAAVPEVAAGCGQRGVRALVVITSALDAAHSADLLATCRRYGMRLAGPNCFGVAVPALGLDATFAARHPAPGVAGLVMQSGGLGFTLADHLSSLGVGISSFASVGNKLDVSANDMLMWWQQDGVTRLAVLYLESFGNPRKFARIARHAGRTMPVLTLEAGRSAAGQRAAASHTAAVATPVVTREALFKQAGIIAVPSLGELLDVAALLATQPVPAGRNVAIISNIGGAGVLTADACTEHGLTVHTLTPGTQRKLRAIVPPGGAVAGPVDTTAAVTADQFRHCLELVAADADVNAMIALVLPTAATGDLEAAIRDAVVPVPFAAVTLDQTATRLLPRASGQAGTASQAGRVPAYTYPEAATSALARAAAYGSWRSRPPGYVPDLRGIRDDDARVLVRAFLDQAPAGGWLPQDQVTSLLACYGIPLTPLRPVASEMDAAQAAAASGGPVVLKADVPGLVHKTDAGAVRLDLHTETEVRQAFRSLRETFGARLRHVLLQPMITGGTEVIIGVTQEPAFGPLVIFGLGGVTTGVLADHAAKLSPLTGTDADELIGSIRAAPLLLGHRGAPAADLAALRGMLLRVSRLADDLPEVAELDLNPVIARPDGAYAVDARIRLTPAQPYDPFLRELR